MSTFPSKLCVSCLMIVALGCGNSKSEEPKTKEKATSDKVEEKTPKVAKSDVAHKYEQGLILAYSTFAASNETQPALAEILLPNDDGSEWKVHTTIIDQSSNVFHKAMWLSDEMGQEGLVTASGMGAALKLWPKSVLKKGEVKSGAKVLWQEAFGGKFNRMRDFEFYQVGESKALAVATHDQGVVGVVTLWGMPFVKEGTKVQAPKVTADAKAAVQKIDSRKDTFVHEIEIGDLDGDGVNEIYATPSDPNKLGAKQHGEVVSYLPSQGKSRKVVADLGDRHAKEIYVDDVDGDGRDELYVSVEGRREDGKAIPVEIMRFDADTKPKEGKVIATIEGEILTRFLTAGDVDGDGKKELVAATNKKGIFLFKPGSDANAAWGKSVVDTESSGFEHAAIFLDLNQDEKDELYVAADNQKEVRQYIWKRGQARKKTIYAWPEGRAAMTWNIMPIPRDVLK